MLIKNLYKIESFHYKNQQLKAEIFINKEHEIFKGHFPNNPVMPGVCMIQIIKELTEKALGQSLFMEKSNNIKFMALINPYKNQKLLLESTITKDQNTWKVKNNTLMDGAIALKFNGIYRKNA